MRASGALHRSPWGCSLRRSCCRRAGKSGLLKSSTHRSRTNGSTSAAAIRRSNGLLHSTARSTGSTLSPGGSSTGWRRSPKRLATMPCSHADTSRGGMRDSYWNSRAPRPEREAASFFGVPGSVGGSSPAESTGSSNGATERSQNRASLCVPHSVPRWSCPGLRADSSTGSRGRPASPR